MTDRAPLPDFERHATGNQRFHLSAFKGRPFVPSFHPGGNTPGCTVVGPEFRDLHDEFRKVKVAVFDCVKSASGGQGTSSVEL
jgi:peroxiredoxin Q/BCP